MLVNQKITVIKKEKGMTTAALSRATGISHSVISRYESGAIKYIPIDQLDKIASALGVTTEELTKDDIRYAANALSDIPQKRAKQYKQTEIISVDDREVLYCYHMMPEKTKETFRYLCQIIATNGL